MGKSGRKVYLDFLRIVSISAVVIIHVASQFWTSFDVHSGTWQVEAFYDGLVRWAVPVFVMISGALFLDPQKEQPIKKLFGKNVLKIVVLIFCWGLIYALIYFFPWPGSSSRSLSGFLNAWVFGHYHMWFLYMIIGLYVMTPVLRAIAANREAMKCFLIAAFALNTLVPFACGFGVPDFAKKMIDALYIQVPLGYAFYYVLGYYLDEIALSDKAKAPLACLAIAGVVLTICLTIYFSVRGGKPDTQFFGNFSLPVCVTSASLFLLARKWFRGHEVGERSRKRIFSLSSCTLGVYLIHVMIIDALARVGITSISVAPIAGIPLLSIAVIALSFFATWLLKKVPVVRSWMV